MEFKINLEYKRKQEAVEKMSDSELTLDYIQFAVKASHPNGLSGTQRRMFGRIQRKFESAIEEGIPSIDLDTSEFDFIKSSFFNEKTLYESTLSKYVNILEDEIERVSKL